MSETIDFKFNTPVLVTLAFAEGRNVPSKYPGSVRILRTTKDARVFFCDPQLEAKIKALNPAPGVQFEITKMEREGGKGYDWKVARTGNQVDGTYKVPKSDSVPSPELTEPASVATASDVKGISSSCSQSIKPVPIVKPATEVQAHCFRLVDLTAATMKYAQQNGAGLVTRDDARAIALTVYIQAGRSGMLRRRPVERITRDARRAG